MTHPASPDRPEPAVPDAPAPWSADRPLDEALVLRLVQAQSPGLGARAARYLSEGWDSQVFVVEGAPGETPWAVRFPKRREVVPTVAIEGALLELLAPRLPLAVPRFALRGEPGLGFPYPFAGYRLLPGAPAGGRTPPPAQAAERLGAFLRALHATPAAAARAAGLSDQPRDPARMAARAREALPRAREVLPAALLAPALAALADVPAAPRGPFVVVHNDLGPCHVLVDAAGLPSGVIDWSDAALGDPASDFVGVLGWLGPRGLAQALAAWGGADGHVADRAFVHRVRHTTLAVGVLVAAHAQARADAEEVADAADLLRHALM